MMTDGKLLEELRNLTIFGEFFDALSLKNICFID